VVQGSPVQLCQRHDTPTWNASAPVAHSWEWSGGLELGHAKFADPSAESSHPRTWWYGVFIAQVLGAPTLCCLGSSTPLRDCHFAFSSQVVGEASCGMEDEPAPGPPVIATVSSLLAWGSRTVRASLERIMDCCIDSPPFTSCTPDRREGRIAAWLRSSAVALPQIRCLLVHRQAAGMDPKGRLKHPPAPTTRFGRPSGISFG
jgi:hypothetical protein